MATSLLTRKCDLAYFVYFVIHIPVIFCVDLQALYPPSLTPTFLSSLKAFYMNTYKDQFFVAPPPFFKLFICLELVYHVPVSVWAVGGLWSDSTKTPLVLLPYAIETFLTTLVCIVEYSNWDISLQDKLDLSTLYGPYLALSVFMLVDMYRRIDTMIKGGAQRLSDRKRK